MVDLVIRSRLLMQRHHRVGDVVHRNDVHLVLGAEGQDRQAGEKDEGAHHVELRGLGVAAVAQHDAGTEDGARHIRQQLADHVLAKLLGAGVRIVVGAVPLDGIVLLHHFVRALPGHGDGGNMAEAAQAVVVARAPPPA